MASICSRHFEYDSECRLCHIDVRDVLPDYERKLAEAEAAGTEECVGCGFAYYRTIDSCPLCDTGRVA